MGGLAWCVRVDTPTRLERRVCNAASFGGDQVVERVMLCTNVSQVGILACIHQNSDPKMDMIVGSIVGAFLIDVAFQNGGQTHQKSDQK